MQGEERKAERGGQGWRLGTSRGRRLDSEATTRAEDIQYVGLVVYVI